jgi:hypothetical protein
LNSEEGLKTWFKLIDMKNNPLDVGLAWKLCYNVSIVLPVGFGGYHGEVQEMRAREPAGHEILQPVWHATR